LFYDDAGRVLLVKPTYKEGWDLPGGYVEPGETPSEGCEREIKEELGLIRRVGPLLVVDWAPSPGEGDKVLFIFEGGVIEAGSQLQLPVAELSEVRYFNPEELPSALNDRLVRRVTAAMVANTAHQTNYLEHGVPLSRAD
jgi:ADP-ribose pyrophosphatase YjhB (NUDIX family)